MVFGRYPASAVTDFFVGLQGSWDRTHSTQLASLDMSNWIAVS